MGSGLVCLVSVEARAQGIRPSESPWPVRTMPSAIDSRPNGEKPSTLVESHRGVMEFWRDCPFRLIGNGAYIVCDIQGETMASSTTASRAPAVTRSQTPTKRSTRGKLPRPARASSRQTRAALTQSTSKAVRARFAPLVPKTPKLRTPEDVRKAAEVLRESVRSMSRALRALGLLRLIARSARLHGHISQRHVARRT